MLKEQVSQKASLKITSPANQLAQAQNPDDPLVKSMEYLKNQSTASKEQTDTNEQKKIELMQQIAEEETATKESLAKFQAEHTQMLNADKENRSLMAERLNRMADEVRAHKAELDRLNSMLGK